MKNMNNATRHIVEGWGFDPDILVLEEDVDIDLLSLYITIDTNRKVTKLMADITALEAAINSLTAADESVATALTDLRDEVASLEAGTITQDQIDSLTGKVTTAVTALGAAVTPPATPPVETPAETPPAEETPPVSPGEEGN